MNNKIDTSSGVTGAMSTSINNILEGQAYLTQDGSITDPAPADSHSLSKQAVVRRPIEIKHAQTFKYYVGKAIGYIFPGATSKDGAAQQIETGIRDAFKWMRTNGFHPNQYDFMPSTIVIEDSGKGSYGDGKTWHLSDFNKEVIFSKVIQSYLLKVSPHLGYVGIETFSMSLSPYTKQFAIHSYDPSLENLNGSNYSESPERVSNNPIALSQALLAMKSDQTPNHLSKENWEALVKETIAIVNSNNTTGIMTGPELLSAVLQADKNLNNNNGANTELITKCFSDHGVTATITG